MEKAGTFEDTYTRYPFAPLVTVGIAVAAGLKRIGGTLAPVRKGGVRRDTIKGAVGHTA
jgi:hypothetical protein